MPYGLTAIKVESRECVNAVRESLTFQIDQRCAQSRRQYFVGIDRQNVAVRRERRGVLSLRTIARKPSLCDVAAVLTAYVERGILGERIDYDYLIGDVAQRFKARAYALFLIVR